MIYSMMASSRRRLRRPWETSSFSRACIDWVFLLSWFFSPIFETIAFSPPRTAAFRNPARSLVSGTWVADDIASSSSIAHDKQLDSAAPTGLYIHIPYCRRRCRYCDFAIVPIGGGDDDERARRGFDELDRQYRKAVVQELNLIQQTSTNDGDNKIQLQSLYFGGGTPSLAPVETIRAILEAASQAFTLQPNAEVTMEMDPGTFSLQHLNDLKELGINRVSLGVQSFENRVLEAIGRVHRRKDIEESLDMLRKVFGDDLDYSMDLISGLPGVSLASWAETLELAVSMSPPHLSIYDLQIERGTVFGNWYDREDGVSTSSSILPLPSADDCASMYKYAAGYLRAKGYEHYEVSSYALLDDASGSMGPSSSRSRHNQIYWNPNGQWYAVGLGATSSIRGKRFARPRAMKDYIDWVSEQAKVAPQVAWLPEETRNYQSEDDLDLDRITDVIMTRLRTSEGLDMTWVNKNIPGGRQAILQGASLGLELGLAELVQRDDGGEFLRLVDPEGFLFSNSIISSIFVELGVTEDE